VAVATTLESSALRDEAKLERALDASEEDEDGEDCTDDTRLEASEATDDTTLDRSAVAVVSGTMKGTEPLQLVETLGPDELLGAVPVYDWVTLAAVADAPVPLAVAEPLSVPEADMPVPPRPSEDRIPGMMSGTVPLVVVV
jgi:hypothetical protein